MTRSTRVLWLASGLISSLAGCASLSGTNPDLPRIESPPPVFQSAPVPVPGVGVPSPGAAVPIVPAYPDARTGRALVNQRLPAGVKDRNGWATDIFTALSALQIPPSAENICAALAVIEQESSFQADPVVAGLPAIVRRELTRRQQKYGIPRWLLDRALAVKSPDGHSYAQRITRLRTETDVNRLYEDMISELPLGRQLLADYNPVRTGGPMQVSLVFAKAQVREAAYPYAIDGSLRNELFSRRGGVYFGVAHLLAYPASYDEMVYRFADFNAGRHASRNAAFQKAVHGLSGISVAPDGDLLRYRDGLVAQEPSQTLKAVLSLAPRLRMSSAEIARDLRQEKSAAFEASPLYERIFALADRKAGQTLARAELPEITLKGPKISRPLTTAWFAQRVAERHRRCLQRVDGGA
jgi:hypothetical protein